MLSFDYLLLFNIQYSYSFSMLSKLKFPVKPKPNYTFSFRAQYKQACTGILQLLHVNSVCADPQVTQFNT